MLSTSQSFSTSSLRIPPQDIAAEQALLGAVMLRPESLNDIADIITPDDFYVQKHKTIFRGMFTLYDKNEPIDAVSLSSLLKEQKQLESIGGTSYLAELVQMVPSASNAAYYADIIQKKSTLRRLIEAAGNIQELGFNETESVDIILDQAEKIVFGLSNVSKKKFKSLKNEIMEAWERFDRLHKSDGELRGVPTGFRDIDNKLAGLQRSDLIILAARPSVGKTTFALDIARNVAKQNVPVAIFSLEMSSQQLADRLFASESFVDAWKLRNGSKSVTEQDFIQLGAALETLSKLPIFIDDEASNNVTKMRAVARRLKSEHGLGLIVVDYLQLMMPKRDSDSMVQQVTDISRSLKALARELDVPVLALSQLSRAVEQRGGRPRLSDLRDSGSIEQDADVVMFIHREDRTNEASDRRNIAEILIEKHRNGPTGKVELFFDEKRVSYVTMEKSSEFGAF
ncbi:MAG TPA: replicative DNA helicase [Candidatus Paceibacterota bacterium]|nr:replicative DNA helicase [Candidatus Paceibacterota bacterium]